MSRIRVPLWLPITIVILIVLGVVAGPLIRSNFSEEERAANVFLEAIPFILIFVAIVLTFITLIVIVARALNGRISEKWFKRIENLIIIGIVLGIVGMFQPWFFPAFRFGFVLLLVSTLSFILWSKVQPKRNPAIEEVDSATVAEG